MAKTTVDEKELLASAVADVDPDAPEGFFARLDRQLAEHGTAPPDVTIRYRNLTVVVDATTSAKSLPSLPNVLLKVAKVRPIPIASIPVHTVPRPRCHHVRALDTAIIVLMICLGSGSVARGR